MIKSWSDREARKVFMRETSKRLPRDIQKIALRKLRYLDAAGNSTDLLIPPGNGLEALKGDREGQHSIRINDQWRICFRWADGDVHEVEIVDYH